MTVLADYGQKMQKFSKMKRNNFFKSMNMKRKRDEDRQEIVESMLEQREKKRIAKYEVNQSIENILMEDNLAREPSLAREPRPLNENASNQSIEKKIQGGTSNFNLKKLTNFFESKNSNLRGQSSCLAQLAQPANGIKGDRKTTNQPSPDMALGSKNVIGGGLGNGSDPANGGS